MTKNPTGRFMDQRRSLQPTLGNTLVRKMLWPDNIRAAWKRVRTNAGAPGVDDVTIADFEEWARPRWHRIRRALLGGTYRPQPVRRVEIPKPSGKGMRTLGIPTVLDRVITQAIAQVLQVILDPEFSESSFAYRPGRSAHGAIRQIQRASQAGYRIAVDLDVEKFFDEVNHDRLMSRLAQRVPDRELLKLVGRYLRAGVSIDGVVHPTAKGTPQGSPLSPMLANLVLDELDKELERRGHRFARYADDILIVVKSKRAGERVLESIADFLERKLKLRLNDDKSSVRRLYDCTFLGFGVRQGSKIGWSPETTRRFKRRIRQLTNRNWGVSMERRLRELATYLRGWMSYFGLSGHYRPIPELESWIRRRIRMCYWQMWKRPRTRIRNLIKLGMGKREAISTGMSSKGPWHLSRTRATQVAMSNDWLAEQGLVSLKDLWVKSAPLR